MQRESVEGEMSHEPRYSEQKSAEICWCVAKERSAKGVKYKKDKSCASLCGEEEARSQLENSRDQCHPLWARAASSSK